MPTTHLLTLAGPAGLLELEPGVRARALSILGLARDRGLRAGWLSFSSPEPPAVLAEASRAGAFRAVQVGKGGSLSYKRRSGDAVLGDVVR